MQEFIESPQQETFTFEEVLKIWTSPRQVFRFITTNRYEKNMYLLLILAGIVRSLDRAQVKGMGDDHSLWFVLLFAIILGGLFGWISFYIYAAMVSWSGTWLDGKADTQSILRVFAYACIPSICSLVLLAVQVAIFGNEIFKSEGDFYYYGLAGYLIFYGLVALQGALGIWTLVLAVNGISEAQKFSIGKAILNFFLPFILIVAAIALAALLFYLV